MLLPAPPLFPRKRKGRAKASSTPTPPPPAALTLVAATYIFEYLFVELEFDREIDIDGLVGSQITVDDGSNLGLKFRATGSKSLQTPTRMRVYLEEVEPTIEFDVRLNASAASGIVAVDDGGTWAGASNLLLPWP